MDEHRAMIARHEATLNAMEAVADALKEVLVQWAELQTDVDALQHYYQSAQWRADYARSNAGDWPGIPCGVLSQDAVYNALMTQHERVSDALQIAQAYRVMLGGANKDDGECSEGNA